MGRILGIDYGDKRMGLAVTDDNRTIASPFDVTYNDDGLMRRLKEMCVKYGVDLIVIGIPESEEFPESQKRIRKFGARVRMELGIEIDYQNEAYSTRDAMETMKEMGYKRAKLKESINKYAAQKILSDYLLKK